MKQGGQLLTPDEVCAWLQIKKSQLYRFTCENRIPFIKLGNLLRFKRSEVQEWLARHRNGTEERAGHK